MKDTNKIKKIARLKEDNPELYDQIIRDNLNNNPAFSRLLDSLPIENAAARLSGYTWLDKKLINDNGVEENKLMNMSPAEKIETYLNGEDIYGYTEDIIRAVGDAYGVYLPI